MFHMIKTIPIITFYTRHVYFINHKIILAFNSLIKYRTFILVGLGSKQSVYTMQDFVCFH